jgi:hypothetical protein
MSITGISYTPYRDVDKDLLVALFSSEYSAGHDTSNLAFLDWLYARNPAGEGGFVLAIDAQGRYRGAIGVVPFRLVWAEETPLAHVALHVFVHPESRTENLFSRMIKVLKENLGAQPSWLFGYPNANAIPGWKRNKMTFRPDYVLRWNRRILDLRARDCEIIRSTARLSELDFSVLRKRAAQTGKPILAADAKFLAWRFLDHPKRRYLMAARVDGVSVRGYSVIAKDVKPGLDVILDFQGEKELAEGPVGRASRLAFTTWRPLGRESGRFVKRVPFFATGFGKNAALESVPWDAVSLAACDFL